MGLIDFARYWGIRLHIDRVNRSRAALEVTLDGRTVRLLIPARMPRATAFVEALDLCFDGFARHRLQSRLHDYGDDISPQERRDIAVWSSATDENNRKLQDLLGAELYKLLEEHYHAIRAGTVKPPITQPDPLEDQVHALAVAAAARSASLELVDTHSNLVPSSLRGSTLWYWSVRSIEYPSLIVYSIRLALPPFWGLGVPTKTDLTLALTGQGDLGFITGVYLRPDCTVLHAATSPGWQPWAPVAQKLEGDFVSRNIRDSLVERLDAARRAERRMAAAARAKQAALHEADVRAAELLRDLDVRPPPRKRSDREQPSHDYDKERNAGHARHTPDNLP